MWNSWNSVEAIPHYKRTTGRSDSQRKREKKYQCNEQKQYEQTEELFPVKRTLGRFQERGTYTKVTSKMKNYPTAVKLPHTGGCK